MKIAAILLAIFALVSSAVALKNAICGLEDSLDGNGRMSCFAAFDVWSYKSDTNECVEFTYGGCGGNDNRFETEEECEEMCKE